ncbi:MAG: DNA/RNA helicase domain-containing protein, partial [Burkholderiales bacterium]
MKREYYAESISKFLLTPVEGILGVLAKNNDFTLIQTQRDAWIEQIGILHDSLKSYSGSIYFEYAIPRMGRRIDVVLLIEHVIFVVEFKVGESEFTTSASDQVFDYALDLKNFHESSHDRYVAPVLIATNAKGVLPSIALTPQNDKLLFPIKSDTTQLSSVIEKVLRFVEGANIDANQWEAGRYCPTPTIIEAAIALYNNHSVSEITRSDASATNLSQTSATISEIINYSKENSLKSICLVTGVPGAGKTLVGLDVATKHI